MPKGNGFRILVVLLLLLPFAGSAVGFLTDWLFFVETGHGGVFRTMIGSKLAAGGVAAAAMAALLLGNLFQALRGSFVRGPVAWNVDAPPREAEQAARMARPLGILLSLLLAVVAFNWGTVQWEKLLLFAHGGKGGLADPVLGEDIGFYLFRLPVLEALRGFLQFALAASFLLAAAVYFIRGGVAAGDRRFFIDERVRRHLGVLAGLLIAVAGFGFHLDAYGLLFSSSGAVHGAGYADVNARLPVYRLLAAASPVAGLLLAVGLWRRAWVMAAAPLLLVLLYGAGIKGYPLFLQKFKVAPNELALEKPFIESNIRFTRLGYNLDRVETVPFDVDAALTSADIAANDATISNIRLWDHGPLLRTYSQLQQIRTYYKFSDVDNDRYTVNGRYTQVMLSPRELSYADLPSRSWINERMIFTHGNGLALGPVSRISREGLPEFYIKDIPAVSLADIKVTRPEIYFGEISNDYVLVGTKVPEFSYPTSTGEVTTRYDGKGGVAIGSLPRKLLFALRFRTEKILLSSDITEGSRILYYRRVSERLKALAPFLHFDADPYLVISADGRMKWMVDAYTVSDRLPYSKPSARGINYIRNSVKGVVDAYDGTVDLYVSDPDDLLVQAYGRIFPGLLKPLAAMPEDLRRHVRYPHQLLQIQAQMFSAYHMTDPKVFYNKENLWEVPAPGDQKMEPYFTIMRLPGEKKEEYLLLLPFTPSKRDNLAAWLTARCDEPNYGKLLVYTFPRDRLVYGPKQIDARINQDAYISQQLTLWSQRGSEVIRGSMLVIPIGKSLLYVQPLFLSASDKGGLPELRRVIVAYGDNVVMEENLETALQRLFGGRRAAPAAAAAAPAQGAATATQGAAGGLAREAVRIFERAVELQRKGDWGGYGEELRRLEQVLKQMAR